MLHVLAGAPGPQEIARAAARAIGGYAAGLPPVGPQAPDEFLRLFLRCAELRGHIRTMARALTGTGPRVIANHLAAALG